MSVAEIADNKWEVESVKPPVKSLGAVAQMGMMSLFVLVFLWMLLFSIVAMFSTKSEGELERKYRQMNSGVAAPAQTPGG